MPDLSAEFQQISGRRLTPSRGSGEGLIGGTLDRIAPGHGGEFAVVDGYRAVAACGVVLHHIGVESYYASFDGPIGLFLVNLGNFGVAVFFLISGFLLYRPFVVAQLSDRPPPSRRRFWARRLVRILPAYWAALLAFELFVSPVTPTVGGLIRRALLIDIYAKGGVFRGLDISWTLTIELSFYLVLPFIAGWIGSRQPSGSSDRRRRRVHGLSLAVMYIVGVVCRTLVTTNTVTFGDGSYLTIFCFLDWFALGMGLAVVVAWRQSGRTLAAGLTDFANRTWACWLCAAMAYGASVVIQRDRISILDAEPSLAFGLRVFFNGIAACCFLLPAVVGTTRGLGLRILSSRPAVFLGVISYGIYLWHKLIIHWVWSHATAFPPRQAFLAHLAWVLIPTVAVATASYCVIERPLAEWWRQRESDAVAHVDPRA